VAEARAAVFEVVDGDRYLAQLDGLDLLLIDPPLAPGRANQVTASVTVLSPAARYTCLRTPPAAREAPSTKENEHA
jgi:hypothetical protein